MDYVMVGHHHVYGRFFPLESADEGGLIQLISGGGGGGIGWNRRNAPSPVIVEGGVVGELHYGLFEVDGDKLKATFRNVDGEIIDQFVQTSGQLPEDTSPVDRSALSAQRLGDLEAVYFDFLLPGTNRHEIPATLPALPKSGETVVLRWPSQLFPANGTLMVSGSDRSEWKPVPEVIWPDESGTFSLSMVAPENFTDFRAHPVLVTLQLEQEGRKFEPHTFTFLVRTP